MSDSRLGRWVQYLRDDPFLEVAENRDCAPTWLLSERLVSVFSSIYDDTTPYEDTSSPESTDERRRLPGRSFGAGNKPKDSSKGSKRGRGRDRPLGVKNRPKKMGEQRAPPLERLQLTDIGRPSPEPKNLVELSKKDTVRSSQVGPVTSGYLRGKEISLPTRLRLVNLTNSR